MRNFRIIAAALAAFALLSISSYAQPTGNWKERMMSEKIAFFTTEIGISPEEGQAFWPVYNEVNKVHFGNAYYRKDIGAKALNAK